MRLLTVNTGSTSLKLERYDLAGPLAPIADPPDPASASEPDAGDAEGALGAAIAEGADAVAHRFVRLPDDSPPVVRLDTQAIARIKAVASDDPLHDLAALRAVETIGRLSPNLSQFAVSDSAFHRTLPPAAFTYAIPRELTQSGLRRIGYHGLSHEYVAHRGCALAKLDVEHARVITAHLGGGSSLCAVRDGESLDTTMGYTPLEGLPMATRSGSVDPGLLVHLLRNGTSAAELEEMLQRRSGLLGISGTSGDVRALLASADADAKLALDVLAWRLRGALGAFVAVLGGVDLIVFTGGIGQHAPSIRRAALEGGLGLGIAIDGDRNAGVREGLVSSDRAAVAVAVVATREGWQLARAIVGTY